MKDLDGMILYAGISPSPIAQANGSKSSLMPDDDRRVTTNSGNGNYSGIKLNPRNNVNNTWE